MWKLSDRTSKSNIITTYLRRKMLGRHAHHEYDVITIRWSKQFDIGHMHDDDQNGRVVTSMICCRCYYLTVFYSCSRTTHRWNINSAQTKSTAMYSCLPLSLWHHATIHWELVNHFHVQSAQHCLDVTSRSNRGSSTGIGLLQSDPRVHSW